MKAVDCGVRRQYTNTGRLSLKLLQSSSNLNYLANKAAVLLVRRHVVPAAQIAAYCGG
jgi:hypothetical protein